MLRRRLARTLGALRGPAKARALPAKELDRALSCWSVEPPAPDLAQRIVEESRRLAQRRRPPARAGLSAAAWWPWAAAFPAAFALGLGLGFFITLANLDADASPGEPAPGASASLFEEPDCL